MIHDDTWWNMIHGLETSLVSQWVYHYLPLTNIQNTMATCWCGTCGWLRVSQLTGGPWPTLLGGRSSFRLGRGARSSRGCGRWLRVCMVIWMLHAVSSNYMVISMLYPCYMVADPWIKSGHAWDFGYSFLRPSAWDQQNQSQPAPGFPPCGHCGLSIALWWSFHMVFPERSTVVEPKSLFD